MTLLKREKKFSLRVRRKVKEGADTNLMSLSKNIYASPGLKMTASTTCLKPTKSGL